jgi:formylglycine-generating enzyme required for sulfatase activity
MGSRGEAIRTVEARVSSFFISETEVTQDLYTAVMGENPSYFKGGDLPVDSVSWFEAAAFCNALSVRAGLPPAYVINGENVVWDRKSRGYRLPTEAEWEYAAREGRYGALGSEPLGRAFFAGCPPSVSEGDYTRLAMDYGWFRLNSVIDKRQSTQPVKGKLPNKLGLYDMSGNVWEWCWDWQDDYPPEPVSDYAGPAGGKYKVARGGSYFNDLKQLTTTTRTGNDPAFKYRTTGFRIAQNG